MKTQLIFLFTFLFFFAQAQLQENTWYKVSKITDGDTFYVTSSSEKYKIRLIGIDAPEIRNVGVKVRKEYFGTDVLVYKVNQPFLLTETLGQYDVTVNVFGGGITGQAEAIRLGVSRALCEINEEFRLLLKPHGLLTRDARMVERKKPGQKKARKRFQFSKR